MTRIFFFFLVIAFSVSAWTAEVIRLGKGEVGILAYGSLMDAESMSRTLGRPYRGIVKPVQVRGYGREFSAVMPNEEFYELRNGKVNVPPGIAYLNAERRPEAKMLGFLFVIPESDIPAFDHRERIYRRVDVSHELEDLQVKGGQIHMYVARPENHISNFQGYTVTRKSYRDLVEAAVASLSPELQAKFWQATIWNGVPVIRDLMKNGADPFGYKNSKIHCEAYFLNELQLLIRKAK